MRMEMRMEMKSDVSFGKRKNCIIKYEIIN